MAIVFLGLGSNLQAKNNLRLGVEELRVQYALQELAPVYRSKPFGFSGTDFLNTVARVETTATPAAICDHLEVIHETAGRERGDSRYSSRTLDIDLLMYDDQVIDAPPVVVPRSDILKYSFVLKPLADIAPDLIHPVTGCSIQHHWQTFDETSHPLQEVSGVL